MNTTSLHTYIIQQLALVSTCFVILKKKDGCCLSAEDHGYSVKTLYRPLEEWWPVV